MMVDMFSILGDSLSEKVSKKFMLWRDARNKKGKWMLPGVYMIAKHVPDDREKRRRWDSTCQ